MAAFTREADLGTKPGDGAAVTLTIDGREVTAPRGTSVMRAAATIGSNIPKLCATDNLEAFGSCRLCLIEVEGGAGYPASCTTPVVDGMVVHTQTPKLAKLRRGVMELYISDHPLDCLTCAANGDCELQTQAGAVGLRTCVMATRARTNSRRRRTPRTPISISIYRSASSARAACARATRCRAPSH